MTIALDRITIRYGAHVAVEDLSCSFPSGAVGLLGRNGAGKSSILKALLGLVRPSAGTMSLAGTLEGRVDQIDPRTLRENVGYMPERDAHVPACSGFEMVALLGRLGGLRRRDAWRRAHEVLYLVGLGEQRYRPVAGYSTGMRQKVKLAAALVHDPKILFLDEPTNGLDPEGREDMLGLVKQLSRAMGKSVLMSTHILQDVEAVCDAAVVLERGRVVAQGSIAELTGSGPRRWLMVVDPVAVPLEAVLAQCAHVRTTKIGAHEIELLPGASTQQVFAAIGERGAVVRSFVPRRRTLEEVFLEAVQVRAKDTV